MTQHREHAQWQSTRAAQRIQDAERIAQHVEQMRRHRDE
jgi:hypothetical protein